MLVEPVLCSATCISRLIGPDNGVRAFLAGAVLSVASASALRYKLMDQPRSFCRLFERGRLTFIALPSSGAVAAAAR